MAKKTAGMMAALAAVLTASGCTGDVPPEDVCNNWMIDNEGGYVCEEDGEFIDIDGKKKKKKGMYYYGGSMYSGKSVAVSSGAFSKSSGFGSGSKGFG